MYVHVCTRDIISNRYVHVCTRDIISNRVCTRGYTGHHIESCMYTYVHGTSYRILYVHVGTRGIISNRVCTRQMIPNCELHIYDIKS